MIETSLPQDPRRLNVATWNILLDKTRTKNGLVKPQHERVESQAKTLMELGLSLDVVTLQEVEGGNGDRVAELTSCSSGFWSQHNRKNEHIGVFGREVGLAEFHELGNGRKAVVTKVGNLAIFGIHFSARPKRYFKRAEEARVLCELIDKEDEAVIAGDFNGPRWELARRMLARQGFSSVFSGVGLERPSTYPTEAYRDTMWTPRQQTILRGSVSIDDIMVRGVNVAGAGTFVGDSDHAGIWTSLLG